MHEILRAMPPILRVLRLMRFAVGLTLSNTKTVVVNYSSESNFAVKRILSELGGAISARVGTYLGFTLGPESCGPHPGSACVPLQGGALVLGLRNLGREDPAVQRMF